MVGALVEQMGRLQPERGRNKVRPQQGDDGLRSFRPTPCGLRPRADREGAGLLHLVTMKAARDSSSAAQAALSRRNLAPFCHRLHQSGLVVHVGQAQQGSDFFFG